MATIKTNAVFASTLKSVAGNMVTVRNDVQACLIYAFKQYSDHGNTTFMNRVRAAASTSKALPCKAIEDYVTSHANVTYKDKKFSSKNTKDRTVKAIESKWFDSINAEDKVSAPKQTDILKLVQATLKQVTNKAEKDLLNDNSKQVEMAEAMLVQFIASLESRGFTVSK